ncbi:methyltransferase family protein [Micromonospora radicis]|uniref:Isoprenylcysteine carboxylmethyltransferase family protein n=1 Tax=Micromonospora radicis TaxID=1894971 RepID=A0A418MNW2_9ACTN|nr:isoprenylcysteine carboxylmethyltransferase family protein [Micromonospora radicis]RIV32729.1 isoprenylcysteine carboxylmethyltransferase family protein [Micromonospora radicis]
MTGLALGLYVVGLALAFGWRSVAQWRATGDSGLRLHAGPVGSTAWWAKTAFLLALLLGLAGPIAGLGGLPRVDALDHGGIQAAGLTLAVAGLTGTLGAQLQMGTAWRVGVDPTERTTLVTTGAFALTRNPIFAAMMVTSAGLALMVANPVALAAMVVLIGSVQAQVRAVEEPYLRRVHGPSYAAYAARVGRFAPGLGRRRCTDR